ncbi:MAG: response regulator [Pirellulales bacterium]
MGRSRKVLLVDDNAVNLEILEELLGEEFILRTASTSAEALRIAKRFRPRVILLDVMLPDADGYETCRLLRREPGLSQAKIVMLSAKAMPSERQAGYDAGADDYITKPFDDNVVLKLVRSCIDTGAPGVKSEVY